MIDVNRLMARLMEERPLFHSEADFQHALAWQIKVSHPDTAIRLEYRPAWAGRPHIDIWLAAKAQYLAIELKYRTRQMSIEWLGETYELLSHSAQDVGRYDFVKDVHRLELVTEGRRDVNGLAVILTNDSALWKEPRSSTSADSSFRIHEGRTMSGVLEWGETAGPGTRKGREQPIALRGNYAISWRPYSRLPLSRWPEFRYAAVAVRPTSD